MGLDIQLYDAGQAGTKPDDDEDYTKFEAWHDKLVPVNIKETIDGVEFEVGYLRSSYNAGGFNHVVKDQIGSDFYTIFEPGDEYAWLPTKEHLQGALVRGQQVVAELGKLQNPLLATDVSAEAVHVDARSAEEAIAVAKAELAKEHSFGGSYTSAAGEFHLENPLPVIGAIPGHDILGRPCVYLVFRQDEEGTNYYRAQAKCAVRLIEEALKLDRPFISWSG